MPSLHHDVPKSGALWCTGHTSNIIHYAERGRESIFTSVSMVIFSLSVSAMLQHHCAFSLQLEVCLIETQTGSPTLVCLAQSSLLYFGLRMATNLTLSWNLQSGYGQSTETWRYFLANSSLRVFVDVKKQMVANFVLSHFYFAVNFQYWLTSIIIFPSLYLQSINDSDIISKHCNNYYVPFCPTFFFLNYSLNEVFFGLQSY